METLQGGSHVFRNVLLMALIGFLAIFLAGPVLALMGILLPFVLVGFIIWLGVKAIVVGPAVAGRIVGKTLRTVLAGPVWVGRQAWAGLGWVAGLTRGFVAFVFPVVGGACAGAMLGMIGGMQHHDAEFRAPAGALIGATIGLVASAWRTKPKPTVVLRPGPEPVHQA
jgi:hypothetical protein